jgi:hypothetical protein
MISSVEDATKELWVTPTREECERLRGDALREIQPGHELHGVELRAMAKCRACDDVAFACGDELRQGPHQLPGAGAPAVA